VTGLCFVYVTTPNKEEAEKISKDLISLRLAACANIIDNVTSLFMWENKEQKEKETVLVIKTREDLLPEVEKNIKKNHSYSCPCIVALPIVYASKDFAEWIRASTAER